MSFTLVGTATNRGDDRDRTTVEALITPVDEQWGPTRVLLNLAPRRARISASSGS